MANIAASYDAINRGVPAKIREGRNMRTLYVVTAPSGYWEHVSSSFDGAQYYMDRNFPNNWDHSYTIKIWEAFQVDNKETE